MITINVRTKEDIQSRVFSLLDQIVDLIITKLTKSMHWFGKELLTCIFLNIERGNT